MAFINTIEELKQYKKRIELQNDVLPLATLFSEEEKFEISVCYETLLAIANNRIAQIENQSNNG